MIKQEKKNIFLFIPWRNQQEASHTPRAIIDVCACTSYWSHNKIERPIPKRLCEAFTVTSSTLVYNVDLAFLSYNNKKISVSKSVSCHWLFESNSQLYRLTLFIRLPLCQSFELMTIAGRWIQVDTSIREYGWPIDRNIKNRELYISLSPACEWKLWFYYY